MLHLSLLPNLSVSLYDSEKDMPATLYQSAKQYEIMAAELGQNEQEQMDMLIKAEEYALAGKIPEFQEQMSNYRLARAMVKQRFQAGQLDWACHVYSVNDVPITDYSEDALVLKIEQWSTMGLTQRMIEESLADVKKKSMMA